MNQERPVWRTAAASWAPGAFSSVGEATLADSPSARKKNQPPKKVQAEIVPKADQPPVEQDPQVDNAAAGVAGVSEVPFQGRGILDSSSPARQRDSEQAVARATKGLMRVTERRQLRGLIRRLILLLLAVAVAVGLWRFLGQYLPPDLLNEYWSDIESKLTPILPADPPDPPPAP